MSEVKFNEPFLTGRELSYVEDVFRLRHFYGAGKYTQLCEDKILEVTGASHALLTDSCTSALEISALLLRDFSKEQEVIVPSYTFTSTAAAFARAGFKVVFCEVDVDDLMIDVEDARRRVTERTVAIVPVHYGGMAAKVDRVCELANEFDLVVVEDSAQAFGAFLNDRALGTFGDFGCFSFHETKNLQCGLGGALLVNNPDFVRRARSIWERGTNRQEVLKGVVDKYTWVEIGGSFYPTEIQAAFLYAQFEEIESNRKQRRVLHDEYISRLAPLKLKRSIHFPEARPDYASNYHAFYVIFRSEAVADAVRGALKDQGIMAYIGYVPLHSSPVGLTMGYEEATLPVTENVAKRVLRLPMHNNMNVDDVSNTCKIIEESLRNE